MCLMTGNMCVSVAPFGIYGGMGRMAMYVMVMVAPYGRLTVIPCVMGVAFFRLPCA
jgi:hypothetical protein